MTGLEDIAQYDRKEVLRKILTRDAFERLSRVKLVNPGIASQLETYLVKVYQSGQLKRPIDDNKLKSILEVLTPEKKVKIKRRYK